jgi:AP-2 complex subunit alpha
VDKELAKVRNKFASNKALSGYQRKKYIWKLLYMYILGYEIDFAHFEAANLINSPKFSEKYTGYIAVGNSVNYPYLVKKKLQYFRSTCSRVRR